MTTQTATTDNPFVHFFVKLLPSHLKRIIFLASISAAVKGTNEADDEFITKLNTLMQLSSTGNGALKLPIYINKLIWKHKEYIQKDLDVMGCNGNCDGLSKANCIERVNKIVPSWLRYADTEAIASDLHKLFRCKGLFSKPNVQ